MTADEFNHLFDAAVTAHMPDFEPDASMPRARLMELMEEATHAAPGSTFLSAATAMRGQRQTSRLGQVHPAAALPREPAPAGEIARCETGVGSPAS